MVGLPQDSMTQKKHGVKDGPLQEKRVSDAQYFAGFTGSDARVGGHAVVVVESRFGAPRRDMRAAVIAEDFLEAGNDLSCARVARRNGAARAGITALEIHFANAEAHGAALFLAEESIFPERRYTINFERRAEALARFVDVHTTKEIANSLQTRGGNNCWAVGDGVIRKSFGAIADGDR